MTQYNYSVVIPVYNEANRISKNIGKIFSFFANSGQIPEIIFVNDGSTDKTQAILESYLNDYNYRIIQYQTNRGKGYAVKRGALVANGDWVIFFDIDLATPLVEFTKLVSFLQPNDQIVIGSRRACGAVFAKKESILRTFLGQGFTKLSNILVPKITDFTCGFKCFSKQAVREIFPLAQIDRWGFDTELLYIAYLHHLEIREMPVVWTHNNDSRVKVLNDVFGSLRELVEMIINNWRGFYK